MCLIISKFSHFFHTGPKIAKRDIKVYKGLIPFCYVKNSVSVNNFLTPFQKKLVVSQHNQIIMESELDSPRYGSWNGKAVEMINKGIHAYRRKNDTLLNAYNAYNAYNIHLFKAIIPKGSSYYIGMKGEIVSNKLIVYTDKTV